MKNLIKAVVSVCMVCFAPALPSVALDGQAVENAVLRAEAAQREMPTLSAQQMEVFQRNLAQAVQVMQQDELGELDPARLGEALLDSVSRVMEYEKAQATHAQESLSDEEQRAVYYALYTLLPAQNRQGLLSVKEYSKAYPVKDWDHFRKVAQYALETVNKAVAEIALETRNYRYSWLFVLTH